MTALVHSELLKLRTTRARFVYPLVIALLAGVGAAGTIGNAFELERTTAEFQGRVVDVAGLGAIVALILGIVAITTEFRHGTITPALLVAPVRERVLVSKAAAAAVVGALLGAFALAIVAAVAVPWYAALDVDLLVGDREVWLRALKIVLVATLWGTLGVAIGALVVSQIGALVGTLIWLLIAEPLVGALLRLIDVGGVVPYLPGSASEAVSGSTGEEMLGFWGGLGVVLAYLAIVGGLGVLRVGRKDIT